MNLPGTMTHPLFYDQFLTALAESGYNVIGVHTNDNVILMGSSQGGILCPACACEDDRIKVTNYGI